MGSLLNLLPGVKTEDIPQASAAIRKVLAETIEHSQVFPTDQGLPTAHPYYALFAKEIRECLEREAKHDWAFITFNYDIALDFALHSLGLKPRYFIEEQKPIPEPTHVPLLKLHGSLNWSLCSCGKPFVVKWDKFFSSRRIIHSKTITIPVTQVLPGEGHNCGKPNTGAPAIIPPSWNKTQYHPQIAAVWRQAAKELVEAEVLVVAGYSMPQTDEFFRDLFRIGANYAERLRKIIVVNTDEAVGKRFQDLLGKETRDLLHTPVTTPFQDFARELIENFMR